MMDELKKRTGILYGTLLVLAVAVLMGATATAAESGATQQEVDELKRTVGDLAAEVNRLKGAESGMGQMKELDPALSKLRFGGYGEMHANFSQASGKDQFDFHRMVLYMGYDFADWIIFNSELELEHALVTDGGDGELSIEQAYLDFLFTGKFNVRVGRILTPLGIVNKKHEPTMFNGVERPSFARVIIPTTWPSDGAGVFGRLTEALTYEAYVVGSLDGRGFDSLDGIRGGVIKERPSLNEPAITGRVDYDCDRFMQNYPDHTLRVGASGYYGGLRNGNQGENAQLSGEVEILSADFEYTVRKWDFRGVIAHINISGASQINNR
ncbi:MAG: porin, partial [Planctomycetota bacterium]